MDNLQFCYWLKGFMEIGKPITLNSTQVQEIKNHIKLVRGDLVEYYKNPQTWSGNVTYCHSVDNFDPCAPGPRNSIHYITC